MKKDKHILINVSETDYLYLCKLADKEKNNLTNYCYNRLLDHTRFDYNDILNSFIDTSLGLNGFINYINNHYLLYSKLDYTRLLKAINDAINKYKSDYCFNNQNIDNYINDAIKNG